MAPSKPARSPAQRAAIAIAKKAAADKAAAKKPSTKKSTARKTTVKKSSTVKKVAKKPNAKKSAAKKVAKKPTVKKSSTKKVAKKPTVKKPSAKKVAKKPTVKKSAAKKVTVKKSMAVKKVVAKKKAVKKPAGSVQSARKARTAATKPINTASRSKSRNITFVDKPRVQCMDTTTRRQYSEKDLATEMKRLHLTGDVAKILGMVQTLKGVDVRKLLPPTSGSKVFVTTRFLRGPLLDLVVQTWEQSGHCRHQRWTNDSDCLLVGMSSKGDKAATQKVAKAKSAGKWAKHMDALLVSAFGGALRHE